MPPAFVASPVIVAVVHGRGASPRRGRTILARKSGFKNQAEKSIISGVYTVENFHSYHL